MDIFVSVLPVFLIILCGFFLRRYGVIGDEFVKTSNALIYYVLLPSLLFYKIGTSSFDLAFNPGLIIGSYISTILAFFASLYLGRLIKLTPFEIGAFVQGSFRGNLAYVGLPVVFNTVGDLALRKASVLLGFMVPLLTFLAVIALLLPQKDEGERGERKVGMEIVTNPLIIASFVGIVWSYFELKVPPVLDSALSILSSATLPLALLCLGGSLNVKIERSRYLVAGVAALFKTLFLPLTAVIAFHLFGLRGTDMLTGTIMMAAPTAVISYVFAFQLKGDSQLASSIVVVSTLLSVLSITLWIYVVKAVGWG